MDNLKQFTVEILISIIDYENSNIFINDYELCIS